MSAKKLTPEQEVAYRNLGINSGDRVILCLDGGGIRGILTIQLLKKMEEIAGIPCHQFCDLVAGTSTGSIIGGLIAFGKTAAEIEELYIQFVTQVFLKRSLLASRFFNMPLYDKKNYRDKMKTILGDITLQQACEKTGLDIMITSKDATGNEETYFTCFNNDGNFKGTYRDALLRVVMEATMSAPTYFRPMERFLDGGTTTYNNPSMAAIMEAVRYDGQGKYETERITMFSLGTGKTVRSISPDHLARPKGIDAMFWLSYVMDVSGQDASAMQVDLFRSGIMKDIDYRRFQISLDTASVGRLPNRDIRNLKIKNADWLSQLTTANLDGIALDDISKFDLMKVIGEAMVDYIMLQNKFLGDLVNPVTHGDELVTSFGNVPLIKKQVSDAAWIDGVVPTK